MNDAGSLVPAAMRGDTLLCISEDAALPGLLSAALVEHDLSLLCEGDVERSLAACGDPRCCTVIVDAATRGVTLPLFVFEVRRRAQAPLIVILKDADQKMMADLLDSGADDCVGRPVHGDNLVARIRAVMRRHRQPGMVRESLCAGDLRVDPLTRTVSVNGERIGCTPTEYEIVEYLVRRAGRVVPRDQLVGAACGRTASPLDRAVDVHVSHLRRKLRSSGQRIVTVRGVGYSLAPGPR